MLNQTEGIIVHNMSLRQEKFSFLMFVYIKCNILKTEPSHSSLMTDHQSATNTNIRKHEEVPLDWWKVSRRKCRYNTKYKLFHIVRIKMRQSGTHLECQTHAQIHAEAPASERVHLALASRLTTNNGPSYCLRPSFYNCTTFHVTPPIKAMNTC